MKPSRRFLSLLPAALALSCLSGDPTDPLGQSSIAGRWEGVWHSANPPLHWRLDLDAQPGVRVTGTFEITSASPFMVPAHGTIEGTQTLSHVVLHASSPPRVSCVIQGTVVESGTRIHSGIDCSSAYEAVPVEFLRVR